MDTFPPPGPGSGRSLPAYLLFLCACATIFTCVASTLSVWLQLKHYYRPMLQRYVVRILILPPLYAVASTISLFSLQLAEMIDLLRDLYEAFVIYCFFNLLIEYLSSEGSILIMLRGRPPTPHFFPLNLFLRPLDLSDPRMFLMLKRGILQYVQVKPILALVTVLLKVLGEYHEGHLQPQSGYTWTALVYNVSVFLALYCLALFWAGLSEDLAPFRVGAKFLCVKGVIFFSFWQGLCISILVSSGIVKRIGGVVDDEYLSTALQDTLICLEMPFFAVLHTYAFSYSDYVEPPERMAGRLPIPYALRDSLGIQDLVSDWAETLRGSAYTYRKWEAATMWCTIRTAWSAADVRACGTPTAASTSTGSKRDLWPLLRRRPPRPPLPYPTSGHRSLPAGPTHITPASTKATFLTTTSRSSPKSSTTTRTIPPFHLTIQRKARTSCTRPAESCRTVTTDTPVLASLATTWIRCGRPLPT